MQMGDAAPAGVSSCMQTEHFYEGESQCVLVGISVCNTHGSTQVFYVFNRTARNSFIETLTCIEGEVVVEM